MIRDIIDIKIKMIITKKMLCKFTAIDPQRKKKKHPLWPDWDRTSTARLGSHGRGGRKRGESRNRKNLPDHFHLDPWEGEPVAFS